MAILKKGWGFEVGQNFARAPEDTPIRITEEYARPGHVIGYIAGFPDHALGFMRGDKNGDVRIHVTLNAIEGEEENDHVDLAQQYSAENINNGGLI